jgi:hypothetical protein
MYRLWRRKKRCSPLQKNCSSFRDPKKSKDIKNRKKYFFTVKKENQIFLVYKEIQSGAFAKSYVRKDFLIYEEMRKYFPMYKEAVSRI